LNTKEQRFWLSFKPFALLSHRTFKKFTPSLPICLKFQTKVSSIFDSVGWVTVLCPVTQRPLPPRNHLLLHRAPARIQGDMVHARSLAGQILAF
jgi:hypothetical protein